MRTSHTRRIAQNVWEFLVANRWYIFGVAVVAFWCLPYFTLGNRVEWGDFSFLAQSYEAMETSIFHYHQFPWWNPWESGGVPLYADPQMGLFSLQMLLSLLVGPPIALQLTVAVFTFLGYGSMLLLLRRYFKVAVPYAVVLSVLWILCSFFASHLPSHFTFIWYLVAPFFVYLALAVKSWRGGIGLGVAFAIMALSAMHNAFFHILLVCGAILLIRLFIELRHKRWQLLQGLGAAVAIFIILAGHRAFYTIQYVQGIEREIGDPTPHILSSISGAVLPFSRMHDIPFPYPSGIHGFGELTGTIGVFASIAAVACVVLLIIQIRRRDKTTKPLAKWLPQFLVLGAALGTFFLALGSFLSVAPYALLKHLPVFGQMRVPTRWYVWMCLALLVFIGITASRAHKEKFRRAIMILLLLGVAEMLILNWNYQPTVLSHRPVIAPKPLWNYEFVQMRTFGETLQLPSGDVIPNPNNSVPHRYAEYEATTFNVGIIEANNALIDIRNNPDVKRCSYAVGCGLVLTNNAEVAYWSPNKIVLRRTADGPISLNINNSNYFLINGLRQSNANIAEPLQEFVISNPENEITIEARPPTR